MDRDVLNRVSTGTDNQSDNQLTRQEWLIPDSEFKPVGTRAFLEWNTSGTLVGVRLEQSITESTTGTLLHLSKLLDQMFEHRVLAPAVKVTLKQEIQPGNEGKFFGIRLDPLSNVRVSSLDIEQNVPEVRAGQIWHCLSMLHNNDLGYDHVVLGGKIHHVRSQGTVYFKQYDTWYGPIPNDPLGVEMNGELVQPRTARVADFDSLFDCPADAEDPAVV